MIWIDYLIISIIIFSIFVSLKFGFVSEVLCLVMLASSLFVASRYYENLAMYLTFFENQMVCKVIAIILLFMIVLTVGAFIKYIIRLLMDYTGLASADRFLGFFFGALRGFLIISIALFFIESFTDFSYTQDYQQSLLIPKITDISRLLFNYLRNTFNFLLR